MRTDVNLAIKQGDWKWPNEKSNGFVLDNAKNPIKGYVTIKKYALIDRFGDENTAYFCPFGTPFMMRSLPPSMLRNPDPTWNEKDQDKYRVYEVLDDLTVEAGPIEPGFEQMGGGTQYIVPGESAFELENKKKIRKLSDDEVGKLYKYT